MKSKPASLRSGLVTTIVVCWLLPIAIVVVVAGVLLGSSLRRSVQQEIASGAKTALGQVEMFLESAITDSKAVSYDGVVRSAYRDYRDNGDGVQMYGAINDYLNQSFSRTGRYEAVFISFWDSEIPLTPYVITKGTAGYSLNWTYRTHAPIILERMAQADTAIRFQVLDGKLYLARNLVDSRFEPYATVVSLLDTQAMFFPLETLRMSSDLEIALDDCHFRIGSGGLLELLDEAIPRDAIYQETAVEDHTLAFSAVPEEYDIWSYSPGLPWAILVVSLLALPMLAWVIIQFYRHVTRPMETLADANRHVQTGERGYTITEAPPNKEFKKLYDHFNVMSAELQNQFERSYLEQQATQQAKIKALQSQINPHFLNNTLEIINWEARLSDDERVCAMIEALSTMLDAALDRDGRSQIPLREELGYVDAYLYIIRQRLGENIQIENRIDENILEQNIPRLILQPLVENAVDHDLSAHNGGRMWIRVFREGEKLIMEVEHDGTLTEEDRKKVEKLLSPDFAVGRDTQVGIRNVNQRLKLLYGDEGQLKLTQTDHGTVLARIAFPV